jgi:hypothetical protein
MEALEFIMNKHTINLYTSSNTSSHGHALPASSFSFNATSTSLLMSSLLILEHLIIWIRIKPYFFLLMNVTPNTYFL